MLAVHSGVSSTFSLPCSGYGRRAPASTHLSIDGSLDQEAPFRREKNQRLPIKQGNR